IFLSHNSVAKRGYVQREMKLALDAWQELPEGTIHTIPVRIDECDVPESFRRYHWANLFEPSGFDRIVQAIRAELVKRPPTTDSALEPSFTNSIGMEFVLIPAGTFLMGSPDSDAEASDDEKPAHRVTISQPFYLGKYPVTQAQWETVMGSRQSTDNTKPNHPAINVSWDVGQKFMDKLNEIDKINKQKGYGEYCLPTEAEWEYACRAGTETTQYHHDIDEIAWYAGNSNRDRQPVGQKLPNAWGLYDMLG